jgi:hypothetical protein
VAGLAALLLWPDANMRARPSGSGSNRLAHRAGKPSRPFGNDPSRVMGGRGRGQVLRGQPHQPASRMFRFGLRCKIPIVAFLDKSAKPIESSVELLICCFWRQIWSSVIQFTIMSGASMRSKWRVLLVTRTAPADSE